MTVKVHFIRKWNRSGGGGCPALYVTNQTLTTSDGDPAGSER